MRVSTMKAIDHYLGIPICLLLELYQRLASLFRFKERRPVDRILFVKFFGMGSILLATPMLRAVKEKFPDAEVALLTFAENREIVERLMVADIVLTLRTQSLPVFTLDLISVLWRIRKLRFYATVDMEFFSKFSTIVTYLSGSPVRIGYFLRQLWRGDLLTDHIYYNHYKHITEVFAALAAPLGVTVSNFTVKSPVLSNEEAIEADLLLEGEGLSSKEAIIGFNVNASELSLERRWPDHRFIALARGLLAELDVKLIFVGGQAERDYVAKLVAALPDDGRVVNLAGRTSLPALLGAIRRCRLFVTNDSGPLHLAASLGCATVSFFGPETPVLYGPVGGNALVFYEGTYCSPCLNVFNVKTAPCAGNNICMQNLEAETVLAKMRSHYSAIWKEYGIER